MVKKYKVIVDKEGKNAPSLRQQAALFWELSVQLRRGVYNYNTKRWLKIDPEVKLERLNYVITNFKFGEKIASRLTELQSFVYKEIRQKARKDAKTSRGTLRSS